MELQNTPLAINSPLQRRVTRASSRLESEYKLSRIIYIIMLNTHTDLKRTTKDDRAKMTLRGRRPDTEDHDSTYTLHKHVSNNKIPNIRPTLCQ